MEREEQDDGHNEELQNLSCTPVIRQ